MPPSPSSARLPPSQEFAASIGGFHIETSAKLARGVTSLFEELGVCAPPGPRREADMSGPGATPPSREGGSCEGWLYFQTQQCGALFPPPKGKTVSTH